MLFTESFAALFWQLHPSICFHPVPVVLYGAAILQKISEKYDPRSDFMYPFAVTSVLLAFTLSIQPALLPVDSFVYQNAMRSVYQYVLSQEGSSPVTGVYDAASLTSLDNTGRGWGQGVRLDEQNRPLGRSQCAGNLWPI